MFKKDSTVFNMTLISFLIDFINTVYRERFYRVRVMAERDHKFSLASDKAVHVWHSLGTTKLVGA